jgi:hypothetical protein
MKRLTYLFAATFLSLAVSGIASAACTLTNLDGAWRVYSPGGPPFGWVKCTIEVNSGQVAPNRVCEDGAGDLWLTTGGELSMNDVCRVSGYVDTQFGRVTLVHTFLESNLNQVWMGVIQLEADGNDYFFNGIRGLPTGGVQ